MEIVRLENITKKFDNVTANDNITLSISKGEIHALVGENGAGKTTLMKILYGMFQPNDGKIFIYGEEAKFKSPIDAINKKIGMVHQHFLLVDNMTMTDNIILGNEKVKSAVFIDYKNSKKKINELINTYELHAEPDRIISEMQVNMQQKTEILKLLYRDAEILILDEPTAVLTPQEISNLFQILRNLKRNGKTCIIITHKVNEVLSISDTISVLRRGKLVTSLKTSDTNAKELTGLIVGGEVRENINLHQDYSKFPILRISGLTAENDHGQEKLKGIDMELYEGEILGLAGIEGNGQKELTDILKGVIKKKSGVINFIKTNENISFIPDDRLKFGIVPDFDLTENILLGRQNEKHYKNHISINFENLNKDTLEILNEYDVRPPLPEVKANILSGGNQQKLIVGREMSKKSNVIIANQPTRGLDVKAAEFVHKILLKAKAEKRGILLISSDLSEILKLSDRIAVIYNGKIKIILNASVTNEKELGEYMLGTK